jgi:hypothetical protein
LKTVQKYLDGQEISDRKPWEDFSVGTEPLKKVQPSLTWVLQDTEVPEDKLLLLVDALNYMEIPFVTVGVRPFEDKLSMTPITAHVPTLFYGTTKLVQLLNTVYPQYQPGVFFNESTFDCREWFKQRGEDMLNYGALITPLTAMVLYAWIGDEPRFIRPVGDLKAFAGAIVEKADYPKWVEQVSGGYTYFGPEQEVIIAAPVNLEAEWRFIIVGHKVVAASQYRRNNKKNESDYVLQIVWDKAQEFAHGWTPSEICVMDMALTRDGEYRIIEFNCFNASGFYSCDRREIVERVTRYIEDTWTKGEPDGQYK